MDATNQDEIVYELPGILKIYKSGRVERLRGTDFVPAGTDLKTGVTSKDITISLPKHNISARVFLPELTDPAQKLPLVLYFHGGGFSLSTPFSATYHNWLNAVVSKARVVAVSVDYRLAPEHPIPAAYEDAWAALRWLDLHIDGDGPEAWLNDYADFGRLFLGGVSAGGNIAHNLAMMAGDSKSSGVSLSILGMALEHPYFWGSDTIGTEDSDPITKSLTDRLWPIVCPSSPSNDDSRINPMAEGAPSLAGLGCRKVLVCVAEKDLLRDRNNLYYEALGKSGWSGAAEIVEFQGEAHGSHLFNLEGEKTKDLIKHLSAFYNGDVLSSV